jgi:NTP pyrophosphatase (non-canonical NTP hydrolase)
MSDKEIPIKQYQAEAEATKSNMFIVPGHDNVLYSLPIDVLHAAFGLSTEANEVLDIAKKAMFYGKVIDWVHMDEEVGDILWYVAIYCNSRGKTFEELCKTNNTKLKTRFPDKFTQFHAINRQLDIEREVLEELSATAEDVKGQ